MHLRLVPGVKVLAHMVNIRISAWFAVVREVCWWPSPRVNARTVKEVEQSWQVNTKIDAKSVEDQAGRTSLKTHIPFGDY